ncbi:MAG: hypothetical protein Q9209_002749 [Squamulea sp. 1 TL-2023]
MTSCDVDPVMRIAPWGLDNECDLKIFKDLCDNKHQYEELTTKIPTDSELRKKFLDYRFLELKIKGEELLKETLDWEKLRPLLDRWKEDFEAVMIELSKEEKIAVPDVTKVSYTPYGQGGSKK